MRIVVGISGASGAIYGVRTVEVLAAISEVECHLILSGAARKTIEYETEYSVDQIEKMAYEVHEEKNIASKLASGTFQTDGMIVAPCSIKTLSQIATSHSDNLIARAADVTLKERRRLVLVVRETPLHLGHLELMASATKAGAVILPPVPGFYTKPTSIQDIIDHTITKVLDLFRIDTNLVPRWDGLGS